MSDALHSKSLRELRQGLDAGEFSATELTDALLETSPVSATD